MNAALASRAAATLPSDRWPAWPSFALQVDLLPILSGWYREGKRFVIATLIDTVGSSPRPLGSEMAIGADGQVAGYVSGGCVEAAVALEAMSVLHDGQPRWLDYGQGSEVVDIQLSCGGRIGVLVWAPPDAGEYLTRWRKARANRRPFYVALHRRRGTLRYLSTARDLAGDEFLQCHRPPLRLVLVGADPAILALVTLAAPLGMEVRVLRPHGPVEPPPGLAVAHYDRRALEVALAELALDADCAIYSLAHDSAIDLQVVSRALSSEAACIGVLGSRGKRKQRVEALRAQGHEASALERLRMPAGLRLGPASPQAIALGILAEAHHAVAEAAQRASTSVAAL
ncbi:XdhC family protein [Xanthomonas maliensis]|uniref:XdhC family protein n=1 Tax=Xanthomonas maliensis TaxID=1321368 RepID=UPI0003A22ABE|nr:XdhC family protein [Xanthomonas maliensis]KAB7770170.1 xanthine dehydrogenase [Xanthomonas maliensis]